MKVESQAPTGEGGSHRPPVSPLEQMLDAAVESERHHWASAPRAKCRADELVRPTRAALAVAHVSDPIQPRGAQALVPAAPPARSGARRQVEPLGQRPAPQISGWVRVCAVELGLLTLLTAFLLPVSPTSTARTPSGEVAALTPRTPSAPAERVRDLLTVALPVAVAKSEPHPLDADEKTLSSILPLSIPQDNAPRDSAPRNNAAPRATVDSDTRHAASGVLSTAPERPAAHADLEGAAQRAQAGAAHSPSAKRTNVVTVDDLFGIGGNEPLPPEALDAPAAVAPPPPHARKPAHAAPISSALFYQKSPF